MSKEQIRQKKYMLKVKIFGVNIYVCNLNLKPYLRPLDNRNASGRREFRMSLYKRGGANVNTAASPLITMTCNSTTSCPRA